MTIDHIDLPAMLAGSESPRLEFAYVDESGDTGVDGSATYTLGCLLVPADSWTDRLDVLKSMRSEVSQVYGVRLRDEVKANNLLKSRGPLKGLNLGDGQRRDIYKRHLRVVRLMVSGAFAVVILKEKLAAEADPAECAWEYLLQRLRLRSERMGHPIVLIHDEGDDARVRAQLRRFRRYSRAPQGRSVQARQLIEDPVPRRSHDSFFIQIADLIAYAGFRRVLPPGRSTGSVCNERMWDELGPGILAAVSNVRPDGIVVWPS